MLRTMIIVMIGLVVVLASSAAAEAATFTVPDGDVQGLIDAIQTANGNGEADTINLANDGTYTLTNSISEIPFSGRGNNGLPPITSEITIEGNGATIERDEALNCDIDTNQTDKEFRILYVASTAEVELHGLTLRHGCPDGNQNDLEINGGSIFNAGILKMSSSFASNNTGLLGGAILNKQKIIINESKIGNNSSTAGGGIYNNGILEMSNTEFVGNSASFSGGGIFNEATIKAVNSNFHDNNATEFGGAIKNSGILEIVASTFKNNSSDGGGAILNEREGNIRLITKSVFRENTATEEVNGAGAIGNFGTLKMLSKSVFVNNEAKGPGGAIINGSTANMTIKATKFAKNQSISSNGGAISNGDELRIVNSTFFANSAARSGGAIYHSGFAESGLSVINSSLVKNSASKGGAISVDAHKMIVKNSIVSDNSPTNCQKSVDGNLVAKGANLDSDGSCDGFTIQNADPQLRPLADNGGPTKTLALRPNSPAVDAATGCPPPDTDQRGAQRPIGSACDLGAFELEAQPPPVGEDLGPVETIRLRCDGTNARVSFEVVLDNQQNLFGSLSCNEVLTRGSAEDTFRIPSNRTFTPDDVDQVNLLYYAQKDAALIGGATPFAQRTAEGVLEGDVLRRNIDYILRVNSGADLTEGAHSESGDVGDHPFLAADLDRDGNVEPQGDDAFSAFSGFTNFDPSTEQPNKQPTLVFEAQETSNGVGGFGLQDPGLELEGPGAMPTLPTVESPSVTDVRLTPRVSSGSTMLDLAVGGAGIASTKLTVYDLTGRRVLRASEMADRLSVQAGTLPAGVYLYEVKIYGHDGTVKTLGLRKMVVSR